MATPKAVGGVKVLTIGLVSLRFRLFAALEAKKTESHFTKRSTGERTQNTKTVDAEPVPPDEIARTFTTSDGQPVEIDPREFDRLLGDVSKSHVKLDRFFLSGQLPCTLREKVYFMVPDQGFEEVYAVLRDCLHDSKKAALVKLTLQGTILQYGMIEPQENMLVLTQLLQPSRLRNSRQFPIPPIAVTKEHKRLGQALIDHYTGTFDVTELQELTDALATQRQALIDSLAHGDRPIPPAKQPPVPDLMEALRQSVHQKRDSAEAVTTRTKKPALHVAGSAKKLRVVHGPHKATGTAGRTSRKPKPR